MAKILEITTKIQIRGINPYVRIDASLAENLMPGWRKPIPVLVKINSKSNVSWPTNMMPSGSGHFYLYLHGNMRKQSKTKVGDTVTIYVSFDETYRNGPLHPMPEWFQQALDTKPVALNNWLKLPPSRQKEILRYFSGLKSDEAKHRNAVRAINALSNKREHFMGHNWIDGK